MSNHIVVPPVNPMCVFPDGTIQHCTPEMLAAFNQNHSVPTLGEYGMIVLVILMVAVTWKFRRSK